MGELDGRVMIVTGATAGVGKEIARGLLMKGATVVAIARDAKRGAAVVEELKQATPDHDDHIWFAPTDLTSMKSVRATAAQIRAKHPKVHAVIHNAAMIPRERAVTAEGMELAFACNVAAPYVLTKELLPALEAGAPSRVVFLVGATAPVVMDDLQLEKQPYDGWTAYQRSKFASLMVLEHMSTTLPRDVTVHGAFPGIVDTPGMDDAIAVQHGLNKVLLTLMRPFMRKPERGAYAPIWVASAPALSTSTGRLWTWKEALDRAPEGWDDPVRAAKLVAELDRLLAPPAPPSDATVAA
jgi:NAD(P)-dependent dehydrogenase (short-subunit alcohol dehydrogenase family)